MNARYIAWDDKAVPVRKEGESDADFNARMEWFRRRDRRVPVAGFGMMNFGFGVSYRNGAGVLCNTIRCPIQKWKNVGETYEAVNEFSVDPLTYGSWSVGGKGE